MLIESKRLILRAIEPEDATFLAGLVNDPDVERNLGAYTLIAPVSIDSELRWISETGTKKDEMHMMIETKREKRRIGIISVKNIDRRNASAHLGIMIEKNSWDKGFGMETMSAMVDHLFKMMNIHRIWLRVDEENARAIRCYEKCGFSLEGVLRDDHWRDGRWRSSLVMSILPGNRGKGK